MTRDMIYPLLPEGTLNNIVRLAIVNAIYMKAPWMYPFEESLTSPEDFYVTPRDLVQVQMMRWSKPHHLPYLDTDQFVVVKIPYGENERYYRVVVLPKGRNTLADIEGEILSPRFSVEMLFGHMRAREVRVFMPKHTLEWGTVEITSILRKLGINLAFSALADFSPMSNSPLYIDGVYHRAKDITNEWGSEMAAATAVIMRTLSVSMPTEVRLNRPYWAFVVDSVDPQILFAERILSPKA